MRLTRLTTALLLSGAAVLAACSGPTGAKKEPGASQAALARAAATPKQAADPYYRAAEAAIEARIAERGVKPAKNVILFIGDGMSIGTITAARIYAGQTQGKDGESYRLAMETLPWSALSKTYSHNFQVPDSAATATAMTTGLKNNSGMLGVTSDAAFGNCASTKDKGTDSLFELAERAGLATGLVSTARLTHATPAAAYAESALRDWEADSNMKGGEDAAPGDCPDIARQFVEWPEGDGFEVALGGGRTAFLKADQADPEKADAKGSRTDGRDLTADWVKKSNQHLYVSDKAGFDGVNFASDQRVLGLFELSHMQYELDRAGDTKGEPSIAEMTRAAITRLSQDTDGYVLMVEGGRIDHGHHGANAARALADTVAFDDAIRAALEMTNPEETLIIVTADHAHTMTISGYPKRGNPILGLVAGGIGGEGDGAIDGKPYTTLSYANGPSACRIVKGKPDCSREDLTKVDTLNKDFKQPSLVPMYSETHSGEDVAIFASGPGANLFSGVMEQNEIFHVMGRASGLVKGPAASTPAP